MRQQKKAIVRLILAVCLVMVLCYGPNLFSQEMKPDTISIEKKEFEPGEDIRIDYRCSEDNLPYLWIGIFNPGIDDQMMKDAGLSIKILGELNASVLLNAPDTPGNYQVRLFSMRSGKVSVHHRLNFQVKEKVYTDELPGSNQESLTIKRDQTLPAGSNPTVGKVIDDEPSNKIHGAGKGPGIPANGTKEPKVVAEVNNDSPPSTICPKREYKSLFVGNVKRAHEDDMFAQIKAFSDQGWKVAQIIWPGIFFEKEERNSKPYEVEMLGSGDGTKIENVNSLASQNWKVVDSFCIVLFLKSEDNISYKYLYCGAKTNYADFLPGGTNIAGYNSLGKEGNELICFNGPAALFRQGENNNITYEYMSYRIKDEESLKKLQGLYEKGWQYCGRPFAWNWQGWPADGEKDTPLILKKNSIQDEKFELTYVIITGENVNIMRGNVNFIMRDPEFPKKMKRYYIEVINKANELGAKGWVFKAMIKANEKTFGKNKFILLFYRPEICSKGSPAYPPVKPEKEPLIQPNTSPVACFTVYPTTGTIKTVFLFDAGCSSDAEDHVSKLLVRWDWENDGTWDTRESDQKIAKHRYPKKGIYTVRMQVKDTDGLKDETTGVVYVLDSPPPVTDYPGDFPPTDDPGDSPPSTNCPKLEYVITPIEIREDVVNGFLNQKAPEGYKLISGLLGSGTFVKEENDNTIYPVKVFKATLKDTDVKKMNKYANDDWTVVNGFFLYIPG